MPIYRIPLLEKNGVAFVNPAHVVMAAQPDDDPTGVRLSIFSLRKPDETDLRTLWTSLPLLKVLEAFGPFVTVRALQIITGNPWREFHVRPDAISFVKPVEGNTGRIRFITGEEITIEDIRAFDDRTVVEL